MVHDDVERAQRGGRTLSLICGLPDGSILLVPTEQVAGHCRRILHDLGRPRNSVRFATPDNFARFEGARSTAVRIHHAYFDVRHPRAREAADFIMNTAARPGR